MLEPIYVHQHGLNSCQSNLDNCPGSYLLPKLGGGVCDYRIDRLLLSVYADIYTLDTYGSRGCDV